MTADTLSEVLKAVRLKGAVFFDVEASAPWVAEALPAREIATAILPDSEHVMEYHVVTSGSCWASVIGRDVEPVAVQAGDVVAFPQGDAHVMASAPGMRGDPGPDMSGMGEQVAQPPVLMKLDGG
ncbi:MAG TPA: cupin domain-containing protein, partial [Rhizomicrobium sp.]|nr:cupin domain-containing protein [Rhizomicrobium sp.]